MKRYRISYTNPAGSERTTSVAADSEDDARQKFKHITGMGESEGYEVNSIEEGEEITYVYAIWQNRRIVAICSTQEVAGDWVAHNLDKYPLPRNSDDYPRVSPIELTTEVPS